MSIMGTIFKTKILLVKDFKMTFWNLLAKNGTWQMQWFGEFTENFHCTLIMC